jgi:hypothetical protein
MPRKSFHYGDDRIEYEVLFTPAKRIEWRFMSIRMVPYRWMRQKSRICRLSIVQF